jgi:hypothetical protein
VRLRALIASQLGVPRGIGERLKVLQLPPRGPATGGGSEGPQSPPGNRPEGLKGDMKGLHSIRINDQWRAVFRWSGGNAFDVRIVDYH